MQFSPAQARADCIQRRLGGQRMQRALRTLHRAQHRKARKDAADRRNRRSGAQRLARLIGLRVAQIQHFARRTEHLPDIQLVH